MSASRTIEVMAQIYPIIEYEPHPEQFRIILNKKPAHL